MQEEIKIETLKTSLYPNLWAERRFIIYLTVAILLAIYVHLGLYQLFLVTILMFAFIGIVFLGFVAIAAHIKYFFYYERNRKVELYEEKMIITKNGSIILQMPKLDVLQITLYDKRHIDDANFFPTVLDSFYYLTITSKNQEKIVLTCLLDIKLKTKIALWYGKELNHVYQFFPFPSDWE